MKKAIALALTTLMLVLSLAACEDTDEQSKPATDSSQSEQSAPEQSEAEVSVSPEVSEDESDITVTAKINAKNLVYGLSRYFHEPLEKGTKIDSELALDYVFLYLFGYMDDEMPEWSEFIVNDEKTIKMHVDGEEVRAFAKILYGDDFDAMKYPDMLAEYLSDSDTFVIPYGRGWGGNYQVKYGTELTVTENENEVLVTAVVTNESEMAGIVGDDVDTKTLTYRFEKIVHRGVEHYRIISIEQKESVSVADGTVTLPVSKIVSKNYDYPVAERKVSGQSISFTLPDNWVVGEHDITYNGAWVFDWTDSLQETDEYFIFDEYVLLTYYKDFRYSNTDAPLIVGYKDHEVKTGTTQNGYPYVLYYKSYFKESLGHSTLDGFVFVKVSDNLVLAVDKLYFDNINDAMATINSLKYNTSAN